MNARVRPAVRCSMESKIVHIIDKTYCETYMKVVESATEQLFAIVCKYVKYWFCEEAAVVVDELISHERTYIIMLHGLYLTCAKYHV